MTEPQNTALDHARTRWHETNAAIGDASGYGNPPDPHLYAALLDSRAGWWDHLGQLADRQGTSGNLRDVYAIACSYAAELDRTDAAGIRFRYRIPTLHPASHAQRIGLNDNRCEHCGRPWQFDTAGACQLCPALAYGITPRNAGEASTYPPGHLWVPEHTLGQENTSAARHERARNEPLTEAMWTELREFAWSPVYEPPAGTPERYRHDALRTALGEAERLAGRARSNRDTAGELYEVLTEHRVMMQLADRNQLEPPKLVTDLMQWVATTVERETYRLREQGLNQLPDKIPARIKPDAPEAADGRFYLRKRTIPEQLDWIAEKLAAEVANAPFLPSATVSLLSATIVSVGTAAAELRAQEAEIVRLHDHADAVELLGHLVDHEDTCCNLDLRGYCLEHHMPDPCEIPAARALLARIRAKQAGGTQ